MIAFSCKRSGHFYNHILELYTHHYQPSEELLTPANRHSIHSIPTTCCPRHPASSLQLETSWWWTLTAQLSVWLTSLVSSQMACSVEVFVFVATLRRLRVKGEHRVKTHREPKSPQDLLRNVHSPSLCETHIRTHSNWSLWSSEPSRKLLDDVKWLHTALQPAGFQVLATSAMLFEGWLWVWGSHGDPGAQHLQGS